jgi:hypothetical protein
MAIINNKRGGTATILATSNTTVTLANLQVGDETVTAAQIRMADFCANGGGVWTIKRGANTILELASAANFDFAGSGFGSIATDETASIVCECTTTGTLILNVSKTSDKDLAGG